MDSEKVVLEGEAITYARAAVRGWREAIRENVKTTDAELEKIEQDLTPSWCKPLLEEARASDLEILDALERLLPPELLS